VARLELPLVGDPRDFPALDVRGTMTGTNGPKTIALECGGLHVAAVKIPAPMVGWFRVLLTFHAASEGRSTVLMMGDASDGRASVMLMDMPYLPGDLRDGPWELRAILPDTGDTVTFGEVAIRVPNGAEQ
jgi:hypothetical protein